jgi:hypothetical protein
MQLFRWFDRHLAAKVEPRAECPADPPPVDAIKPNSNAAIFKNLMFAANEINNVNPSALPDFIAAILRPEQSESILRVAERGQNGKEDIDQFAFFFEKDFRSIFSETEYPPTRLPSNDYILRLGRDAVLPCPWKDSGFINCIAMIGAGKLTTEQIDEKRQRFKLGDCEPGPWKQLRNHVVLLWMPWRIGFVSNGNHSLAAGILAAEGSVIPTMVEDRSYLFDLIECDGYLFKNLLNGDKIADVTNARHAAIFEIGRLITKTIQASEIGR